MLLISIILMNLALLVYTVSILNQFKQKKLCPWHVTMFYVGLIFDALGTFLMYKLGGSKIRMGLHDILGYTALLLMLINAVSATFVLKKYKNLLNQFYKFSIFAWIVWLGSYILGIFSHV